MNIAVVALGKIGLPLAAQFAGCGHDVTGVDVNPRTVETVNKGIAPFPGEAGLAERLASLVPSGKLRATTDFAEAVPGADVVVVVVPLFVDQSGVPDFAWMDAATSEIARNLSPDTLIAYETTLPVGTTRLRWKPMLELGSGLTEGEDFHAVFSPERVLTGRVFDDLRKYPKLIGALSAAGAKAAQTFYEAVIEFDPRPDLLRENGVWDLGSADAAEMAKLAETTYRDVNIALANQFAVFADSQGIDVYSVIEAANSQPYSHVHRPGVAVGGHCIPVYPRLYLHNDPDAALVLAARERNEAMPAHAVKLLADALEGSLDGRTVLVLGASYRGGVKETAYSGVFPVVEALEASGATAVVHDPLFSSAELRDLGLSPWSIGTHVEGIVVQSDHDEYGALAAGDFPGVRAIVDGRRLLDRSRWDGVAFRQVGASGHDR